VVKLRIVKVEYKGIAVHLVELFTQV